MTELEISYIFTIIALLIAATQLSYIISGMKHGVRECLAMWVFRNDKSCMNWLIRHPQYIWCHVMLYTIIFSTIILLSQFDLGLPHIRIPMNGYAAFIIWVSFAIHNSIIYKIIKANE